MELTESQVAALRALDPKASRTGVPDPVSGLESLIEAEEARRGFPDRVTGAFHSWALLHGSLLKNEYDLSTHAHHDAWEIGAVIVDLNRTIALNMRYGFEGGDKALRAVAASLMQLFPSAKTVRIHTDCFAVLLPPSAERPLEEGLRALVQQTVPAAVRAVLPDDGEPVDAVSVTVALLRLRLKSPSHWQVIGPLVWAECERALTQAKLGRTEIVERRIELDGQLHDGR